MHCLPTAQEFEDRFTEYVRSGPGERVDDLVVRGPNDPKLADYLLWDRAVVAEMKCIVQDDLNTEEVRSRCRDVIRELEAEGKVVRIPGTTRGSAPDVVSQRRLWDARATSVKRRVADASKQIRSTASHFRLTRFHGLLILINLADASLTPSMAKGVLMRSIRQHAEMIHFVAFYSPHLGVTTNDRGGDRTLSMTGYTTDQAPPSADMERVNRLMEGWLDFNVGTYLGE